MVSAAWRTRSPTSAALNASNTSSRADWSRAIAYSVLHMILGGFMQRLTRWPFTCSQARRQGQDLHHSAGRDLPADRRVSVAWCESEVVGGVVLCRGGPLPA